MLNQNAEMKEFDAIKISIASPETIRSWSYGEVKKPETVNYRTFQPETDGLFCERIFGPTKNYECGCGKYKGRKYKGIICEKCGVEVTVNKVRRERMGHIELAFPVVHEWFFRSVPSRISIILNRGERELTKVLYFEKYVILDPGATNYQKYSIITKQEYNDILDNMSEYERETFRIGIGAEAIREMLESINISEEIQKISEEIKECKLDIRKKKLVRRLKLLKAFDDAGTKLGDLVLTVLPVLPPELRPLVQLDGGRFATSDLNDLYRRVINRNNRLKKLLEYGIIPDVVLRNEQRMLQESVDSLFNNTHRGSKAVTGTGKRPLKSLSDMIKGKQGRFRQNLLGKRVDYSGRSVITVGPNLKLHQCGLPKDMALELFLPFVYAKLQKYGLVTNLKAAQKLVEQNIPEIWDILEEVMREHPVLLNRAPTLHRLSIQAFEPILMDGKSIRLHPLVCPAFNADFDGDQMAVHVPLSIEAQLEARILMLSTNNLLSPATGKSIVVPSKDIVLGIYYITMDVPGLPNENHVFCDINEINYALENKFITYQTKIRIRVPYYDSDNNTTYKTVDTTPGRVIFSQILPHHEAIPFDVVNKTMTSSDISSLIDLIHFNCGAKSTAIFADKIMAMGFKYMTVSGISYGKDDLIVPKDKQKLVQEAKQNVNEFEQQYLNGFITKGEKYNKVIDVWNKCGDNVANSLMKEISQTKPGIQPNSVYMMVHSKARGSMAQLKQSAGMRGLMAKPSGEIIETPIVSSFKEGLSVLEYFISTHGSRKGLTDTALKTANSGYLTRRLVDVANDCVVCEEDCGTNKGIHAQPIYDDSNTIISISERILGRFTACDIVNPQNGMLIVPKNGYIDEDKLQKIVEAGIDDVYIRSAVTCESKHGICTKCYGRDLAIGKIVSVGEAVGVIAAQSIGEPGTQLTMRTFHIGGTAQQSTSKNSITATNSGRVSLKNIKVVINSYNETVVLSKKASLSIIDENGKEVISHILPYGSKLKIKKGQSVKSGDVLVEWDPYTTPIISEVDGIVKYVDLIEDSSLKETTDELTGISNKIVIDWKKTSTNSKLKPSLFIVDSNNNVLQLANGNDAKYFLSIDTIISVENEAKIKAGDTIAKMPKNITKTKDITGGLPKISELFEARMPQSQAILAEIDGVIEFGKDYKDKKKIKLIGNNKKEIEYVISKDRQILVRDGDSVNLGDMIVDGNVVLHDLLRILGIEITARHFIDEIQKVYRLQGVPINDKHIEVIMRQMLRKREIIDAGDSDYIVGDEIDKTELEEANTKLLQEGKSPIVAKTIIEGITKAAIKTQSFISAASFQETARVLTEAAINSKKDYLHGLKENVIIGRLIPAGTGNMVRQWKEND